MKNLGKDESNMLNNVLEKNVLSLITLIMMLILCGLQVFIIIMLFFTESASGPSLKEEEVQSVLEIYRNWQSPNTNQSDCNSYDPNFYNSLFKAK